MAGPGTNEEASAQGKEGRGKVSKIATFVIVLVIAISCGVGGGEVESGGPMYLSNNSTPGGAGLPYLVPPPSLPWDPPGYRPGSFGQNIFTYGKQ